MTTRPACAYCHKVRSDGDYWERVETYIRDRTGTCFSHGACSECFENQMKVLTELVEGAADSRAS